LTSTSGISEELRSSYSGTVLYFPEHPPLVIDLGEEVGPTLRNALATLGLAEPFGVLTAFNPHGANIEEAENELRMTKLEMELSKAGDSFVRVDACSPDKTHCERSIALRSSRARAIQLAKQWDQLAIFWWDGSTFWIYGAIADCDPIRLPAGL
jgi:hypothetical protein